jgi:hypothetical protein
MSRAAKPVNGLQVVQRVPTLSLDNIRQIVRTSGIGASLVSIPSKAIQNVELAEAWEVMQFRLKHLEQLLEEVDVSPTKKRSRTSRLIASAHQSESV